MIWLESKLLSWLVRRALGRGQSTAWPEQLDPLTRLLNRNAFYAHVRELHHGGAHGAIAVLDLDHFKLLNNDLGHQAGDRVLTIAATRLQAAVNADVVLGRSGGDEFLLFVPGEMDRVRAVLDVVRQSLRSPMEVGPGVQLTASIGVAPMPASADLDQRLSWAEAALFNAKSRGRNQVFEFSQEASGLAKERRDLAKTVNLLQARNQELHDRIQLDALTGLRSRRAWDEFSHETFGGSSPSSSPCAVAFLDIDHFGSINKHFGDACGDDTLRKVAALIQAAARREDLVFRKGGDEIIVVLPGARAEEAMLAAERIRAAVQLARLPTADTTTAPVITITLGVAASSDDVPCSVEELMNRASEAAMRAKVQSQRNRVCLA